MRIVFLATGEIAIPAFKKLIKREDCEVVGLVTQPDRPFGRKQVLKPPAIKLVAEEYGVAVFQPEKIVSEVNALVDLDADFFVVMAYGQLLPNKVIDIPHTACLNLHGSLLPRHRGASPIQAAIMAGDQESGVTVMHVVRSLDAGDIVLAESTPIYPNDTGGSLLDRLAEVAAIAIDNAMNAFASATATRTPQDEALVTYLGKLTRADGVIDWNLPADVVERTVRALDPWPGTTTIVYDGDATIRLKVFPPVTLVEDSFSKGSRAGAVCVEGDSLLIRCGDGNALRVESVQPDGKRRMSVADFLCGHELGKDAICGDGL